jgi:type I restriction enzyme S subunit
MEELAMSCVALRDYDRATFNGFTKRLRPKSGTQIIPEYAGYFFRSPSFRREVTAMSSLSTRASLNNEMLSRLTMAVPPPATQEKIGTVLKALDDKIELNRRMNATLESMARALFQSWFVDFDPVRAKLDGRQPVGLDQGTAALFPAAFEDSSIGPIPHGWSVIALGEIADFEKGLSYKGEGLAEKGGIPMVNLGCFSGRGLFNANRLKRYTGEYRERHLVRAGDLVVANTDMTQNRVVIGSPALVPELNGAKEFLFTHHVFAARLKPGAEIWRRYIFFTLLKPEFREIAEGFSTGTTVLALPRDGLANYTLCIPTVSLLDAFERLVSPILSTVDANLHQSDTLATLRDTLLPKLLGGDLRPSGI